MTTIKQLTIMKTKDLVYEVIFHTFGHQENKVVFRRTCCNVNELIEHKENVRNFVRSLQPLATSISVVKPAKVYTDADFLG